MTDIFQIVYLYFSSDLFAWFMPLVYTVFALSLIFGFIGYLIRLCTYD